MDGCKAESVCLVAISMVLWVVGGCQVTVGDGVRMGRAAAPV